MARPGLGLDLSTKRTRKREFLDEMRRVVPWLKLIALIEPHYRTGKTGRPPFPIVTMVQIRHAWFGLSDPAMEEALYDVPLYREFAGLDGGMVRLPDESTILRFRHLLEAHGLAVQMLALVNEILTEQGLMLKAGSAVDATSIAAPSSTRNGSGTRDPEMQFTQSRYSGQGRTPVSHPQATVRLREDPLLWFDEEHPPDHHAVCFGQFMDGAWSFAQSLKHRADERHMSGWSAPARGKTMAINSPTKI
jgi:transposase, IS5 family